MAHFIARRYEEAVISAKKSLEFRSDNPRAYSLLAASCGHLGQADEAQVALTEMHRWAPDYPLAYLRVILPPSVVDHLLDGWRKAGWKE